MQQLNMQYGLENTLACEFLELFETGHVSLYKYPEKSHDAIRSQREIWW